MTDTETLFRETLSAAAERFPPKILIPIYVRGTEDGVLAGDGFFLDPQQGTLEHKVCMTGWSEPATPDAVVRAYAFHGKNFRTEEALLAAANTVKNAYTPEPYP